MTTTLIVLAILVFAAFIAVLWGVGIYNRLVTLKNRYMNAFSQIEVQLKRRYDLIPNLLETVKGYMAHERGTLEAVTNARAAAQAGANAGPAERAQLEGQLSAALGRLMAVAEAYPDLKANTTFLEFQQALQKVEDELQLARRYYNGTARNLNVAVQSFPSSIVANSFHFTTAQYF